MSTVHHMSVDNPQHLLKALRDRSVPLAPDNIELHVMRGIPSPALQCSPYPKPRGHSQDDTFRAREHARFGLVDSPVTAYIISCIMLEIAMCYVGTIIMMILVY